MGNWMTIDTAPKDEYVIVGTDKFSTVAKQYENGEWYELNNDPTDSWGFPFQPTHWQPLPPPPKEQP